MTTRPKHLYVPVSVNLADDPAILNAGADAEHLYLRALMLAKRVGTDGHVHRRHLARLTDGMTCLEHGTDPDQLAARLVIVGLWQVARDGWQITGWLDWNPSQAELDERREAQRARVRRHREKNDPPAAPQPEPVTTDDDACNALQTRRGDALLTRLSEVKLSEVNKPTKSVVEQKLDPAVDAIFDLWRTECDHPRAHLDQKRRRRIEWALATYPHDDIIDAIHGAAHSPFHQGDNDRHRKYDDLTLIFRDAEHLEQFRDMHRNGPTRHIPRGFGALLTTTTTEPMPEWERPELDRPRKETR